MSDIINAQTAMPGCAADFYGTSEDVAPTGVIVDDLFSRSFPSKQQIKQFYYDWAAKQGFKLSCVDRNTMRCSQRLSGCNFKIALGCQNMGKLDEYWCLRPGKILIHNHAIMSETIDSLITS